MPVAEHDVMLVSAGFAPQAADASWHSDVRAAVNVSVDHVLAGHDPFPAVAIDRIWNPQKANESARTMFRLVDLEVARHPHDVDGRQLLDQLKSLPGVAGAIADRLREHPAPVVTVEFQIKDAALRLFSRIATIGMSMDAKLDGLCI